MAERAANSLDRFIGHCVVLDTQGPLVYIGLLEGYDDRGYWLVQADVHDRSEGHSTNEKYIHDACVLQREGTRAINRRRVFVERAAIVSVSALEHVLAAGEAAEQERGET
jgi:small nuclear ribonucleoprotein (snRNP)-like protein